MAGEHRIRGTRAGWQALAFALAIAACGLVVGLVSASGATTHPRHRRVCKTVKVHRKHRTRRIHFCVTIAPLHRKRVVVHTHSGGFAPSSSRTDAADAVVPHRLPRNPFHPLATRPAVRRIVGVAGPTTGVNAPPPSGPLDVSIASTNVIPISATPERPNDTFEAGEPSVADAGRVVMYTFNWDAVYSTDGGQTWTEMDPHKAFPADDGGFGCDQVVQYDPMTKVFIWVLQYHCASTGVDLERIAWASAANLARYGIHAWKWFDLQPEPIAGKNTYLDQPRLGFTPTFLYISLNQGAMTTDKSGNLVDQGLKHGVVVRIPRTAFTGASSSLPVGYALLDTTSMRVAQNVRGSTEYFVGHNGDGQLRIDWIDDSSNFINDQVVDSPTIATKDWSATTPGGDDMLDHHATHQGTAITGVTQGGDGTVWAGWSEGRQLPNGTHKYAQSHVAFAELQQFAGHSGFLLVQQNEYVDPSFAYALPDLATDASGEVAFDVVWGGGSLYYANHAVGFLVPRDHRINAFEPVADQVASSDSPFSGNPFFDYETVRPLPQPYGNCLAAAGIVNRKDSNGVKVGYPVFTVFSRPGMKCPPRFITLPIAGLPNANAPNPPPQQATSTTLNCPSTGTVGSPVSLSGSLSPALGSRKITISVSGAASTSFTATTQANGGYSTTSYVPSAAGQYMFVAGYAGEPGYLASSSPTCTTTVSAPKPGKTAVSLTCPSTPYTPGTPIPLTGSLSPPLSGRKITITANSAVAGTATTQPDGTFSFSYTPASTGDYSFVASFGGEPGYQSSSSPPCNVSVVIP